jgi:hypothetical protein
MVFVSWVWQSPAVVRLWCSSQGILWLWLLAWCSMQKWCQWSAFVCALMGRWLPALHQYFPGLYIPSCVRTEVIAVLLVVSGFSLGTMSDRVKPNPCRSLTTCSMLSVTALKSPTGARAFINLVMALDNSLVATAPFGGVCDMDIFAKQQWHCPPGSSRVKPAG